MSQPLSAYVSIEEAAEILGMAARAVRRAVEDERLPATKFGKQWAVLRADVEAYGQVPRRGPRPSRKPPATDAAGGRG